MTLLKNRWRNMLLSRHGNVATTWWYIGLYTRFWHLYSKASYGWMDKVEEIWNDFKSIFPSRDLMMILELLVEASSLKQWDFTMTEFLTKFGIIWTNFKNFRPNSSVVVIEGVLTVLLRSWLVVIVGKQVIPNPLVTRNMDFPQIMNKKVCLQRMTIWS